MNKEFCYRLRVRYSECDAQKVVFNGRYSDYVDLAVGEYTRVIWGDYNSILSNGIDNQVVSYSINWKAPAHFDEVISITVKPIRIGNSSYEFQVEFYNYESHKLIASAKIVYVMVSVTQHEKMEIPQNMRKQLEKGAFGIEVDHAGLKNYT
jgi:acyl-CoA thioester hydrolase